MLSFTTDVSSKEMLGDLRVKDQQAVDGVLASGTNLMQVVPQITPELMFGLWKQSAEDAGLDLAAVVSNVEESDILKTAKKIAGDLQNLPPPPQSNGLAQGQTPQSTLPAGTQQPPQQSQPGAGSPQGNPILNRFG